MSIFKWDYSIYLGNEANNDYVDFISNDNVFIVVEIRSSIKKEEIKALLTSIKEALHKKKAHDLESFIQIIDEKTTAWQGHSSFSIAAAFSVDDVVYLLTRGKGQIFIARDRSLQKLIEGDNTSSGYIQDGDYIILTTDTFSSKVDSHNLGKAVFGNSPQGVIEALTPDLKGHDDTGVIALFAKSIINDEEPIVGDQEAEELLSASGPGTTSKLEAIILRIKGDSSRGRMLMLGIVVLLLVIFIWSVVLGNKRRVRENFIKEVKQQELIIDGKLAEAKDLAQTDTTQSLGLLEESKVIYASLDKDAKEKKLSDIKELAELKNVVARTEKNIKKSKEGKATEFYDLNLIEKGTEATKMYLDDDVMALLDTGRGYVHLVSVEKKSVDSRKSSEAKKGQFVALHNGEPYIFGETIGIVKITDENKTEKLVPTDKDWQSIRDFWMYSGNIYLLAAGNDEVYKYLVGEEGYSKKTSYFGGGQSLNLDKATALSIDGALYIANGENVSKYVTGSRDSFSVTIPDKDVDFEDMYADANTSNVYLLDKDSGRIFIISKDGDFRKQISASILSQADDFVVVEDEGALVLVKDKIYKVELN